MNNRSSKETRNGSDSIGKTTIAPDVLVTIARLTALEVPGVSRMAATPKAKDRLLSRGVGEGVRLEIKDDHVYADIYLVLDGDVSIKEVSRKVQIEVSRAISEMVGMPVGRVNIHVEDIDYSPEQSTSEPD